jgi:hypothetical protein
MHGCHSALWGAGRAIDGVPRAALRSPWAIFMRSLRDSGRVLKQNEAFPRGIEFMPLP